MRQLAGIDVKPTRVRAVLKALGFETGAEGDGSKRIIVEPPTWRRDVEGPADLVEELARIEGYDKMPVLDPPRAAGFRPPPASVGESRTRIAKLARLARLQRSHHLELLLPRAGASLRRRWREMLVANPIASDLDCMRPSALPQLLAAAQKTPTALRRRAPVRSRTRVCEHKRFRPAAHAYRRWRARRHAMARRAAADIFDVKRDVLTILEAIGAPVASLQTSPTRRPLAPRRTGALSSGRR